MKRNWLVLVTFGFTAAACGGGTATAPTTGPTTTEEPAAPITDGAPVDPVDPVETPTSSIVPPETTTTIDPGPTAAASLAEVEDAVVRIIGIGTFADPAGGVQAKAGSGSGFVIDPTGIVVTNNHVVTGAALLEVYVAGEETPRNARVLGVSECSDLAVIQIDGTDQPAATAENRGELDYLDWYDGPVTAGMEIFAAGFPLGDSEYTVLDGIVSKENAAGETSWASVDAVIEHSADTLPGSSGGPIVTADGTVVAVNYRGNDLGQSFAIGRDVARPIVTALTTGMDVDAVGINGEAVVDENISGIWVSSVKSGSPAEVAGVQPGDLLLSMESIPLATDGTMAHYCDILRSHAPTDTLAIEVYRPAVDELLEGQLNGRMLESVASFETEFDEVVADDAGGFEYADYTTLTDESGLVTVTVPVDWVDIDGRGWRSDLATGVEEIIGPALTAAPSLDAFRTTWGTPGVFIGASPLIGLSPQEALSRFDFGSDCVYDGEYVYDDGSYTGFYHLYTNCGAEGSVLFHIFAQPPEQTWLAMLQIVAVTDADLRAADTIISSFVVQDLAG